MEVFALRRSIQNSDKRNQTGSFHNAPNLVRLSLAFVLAVGVRRERGGGFGIGSAFCATFSFLTSHRSLGISTFLLFSSFSSVKATLDLSALFDSCDQSSS